MTRRTVFYTWHIIRFSECSNFSLQLEILCKGGRWGWSTSCLDRSLASLAEHHNMKIVFSFPLDDVNDWGGKYVQTSYISPVPHSCLLALDWTNNVGNSAVSLSKHCGQLRNILIASRSPVSPNLHFNHIVCPQSEIRSHHRLGKYYRTSLTQVVFPGDGSSIIEMHIWLGFIISV